MRKETFSQEELAEMIADYSFEVKRLSFQLENTQKALADLLNQAKGKPAPAPAPAPAEEAKPTITEAVVVKEKKEKPAAKTKKAKASGKAKAVKAKTEEKTEAPKRRGRPRKEKVETAVAVSAGTEAPKKKRGRPKKEASAAAAESVKKKESKIRTLQDEESQPKGYRLSDWDLFIVNTIRKSGRVMITSELMDKALSRVKKEKMDLDEVALRGKLNRSIHKLSNRRGDLVKVEEYPGKGFAYGVPEWKDEDGKIRQEYMASMN